MAGDTELHFLESEAAVVNGLIREEGSKHEVNLRLHTIKTYHVRARLLLVAERCIREVPCDRGGPHSEC
eukprot:7812077-Lingulodinium_polyedra.AAC.1